MVSRAIPWLAILVVLLLVVSNLRLWIHGLEVNPFQTIYRTRVKTVYVEAPRDKKQEKKLKDTIIPCVDLKAKVNPENPDRPILAIVELPKLPEGGSGRVTLLPTGEVSVETKAAPSRWFALGELREVALWVDPGFQTPRTWALSYQQDIVRVGPAWLRGRAEYGKLIAHEDIDPHWKAELAIAFRF